MEQHSMEKKIAAAMAAVSAYLAQEASAAAGVYEPEPEMEAAVSPVKLWGVSGRTAQMQNRTLMQMRTFLK